jgi:hypothetical protein
MITGQAEYGVYHVPINFWALNVVAAGNSIVSDSACFMLMYI